MKTRTKWLLVCAVALVLGVVTLPWLARRIDSAVEPMLASAAEMEMKYREMTNAFRIAAEVMPDHPTRRLYEDRKSTLAKAGYVETRELRLRRPFSSGRAARSFVTNFSAHFPGVEFTLKGAKAEEVPWVIVTGRKSDVSPLGMINRFVSRYEPE